MHLTVLLSEEPVSDACAVPIAEKGFGRSAENCGRSGSVPGTQRIHRQRRHPGRKVRIDGPTAISAGRGEQKLDALLRHGMMHLPAACQTHRNKTGQRGGFEETAAGRLDSCQNLQRSFAGPVPRETSQRIARWKMMMAGLANSDERGERVTDHGQSQRGKELMRQRGQLERQRQHPSPGGGAGTESSTQGASGQYRQ